ncbi:DUF3369 domain-containing protein [Psychrobium sp. 1_MG-2023]|uniref:DUF3369 domain-containing protein n=1 Tax=Psychrobium sp. 1_MG-2023 TaxID=3062624 RepID=UPI000C344727|nr:DUF3369 domain-containing protein [Psychrobium sp. 1_MG-2023]MDP2560940.1 DUF3369 domain-containing protein [Psychrobium sp. 1_MG-2023]PKF56012.1 metal-dependent phosphohydrolase [Alteromonadales bacterium alter-6D02]
MDEFIFADESQDDDVSESHLESWKLLIVDDEEEVHAVTKLALRDFEFQGRKLDFISAYSGAEAEKIITEDHEIAVMLLDVVMETDDAGLKVARFTREIANNQLVRIVLRTGQPGQAPERDVIVTYDINDYKSKTELTSQRLFTTVVAALRSYRDLTAIESNRQGLERVIDASCNLFSIHSMNHFIDGLLIQLNAIFSRGKHCFELSSLVAEEHGQDGNVGEANLTVVAAQGDFSGTEGESVNNVLPEALLPLYDEAQKNNELLFGDDYIFYYRKDSQQFSTLMFISGIPLELSQHDRHLIELFSRNVQIAYDNILLNQEIENTQREIVYRLGNALETRSKETGNHLKRVALFSELLGNLYGLDPVDVRTLKLASPLHDVGKIGIPDAVLNTPEKLEGEDWEVMKTHAQIGHDLLHDSNRLILQVGAIISLTHHERWDGQGYPNALSGEDIHIYGRIVSLVDVFDALYSKRCYKPPFELDFCINYIKDNSATAFDPALVELFLTNIDDFLAILKKYPN